MSKSLKINNKDITEQLSTDKLLKTLSSQSNLSIEQVNLVKEKINNKQWHDKTTTLSQTGQLIVQSVVTYFTAGMGGEAAGAITNEAVKQAVAAALQSMVTQATTQLATAAITGNKFELDMKAITKSAVQAGVMSYANTYTNVNTGSKVLDTTTNTLSQSATQTAVYGGDFEDNLKTNAVNTMQAKVSNVIGDNYGDGNLNYGTHKLAHAVSGAVAAKLQGKDASSGALGAVTGEIVGEAVGTRLIEDGEFSNDDKNLVRLSSQLGTITTASVLGKDADTALNSSDIAVENNMLKHLLRAVGIEKVIEKAGKYSADKVIKGTEKAWEYFSKKNADEVVKKTTNTSKKILKLKNLRIFLMIGLKSHRIMVEKYGKTLKIQEVMKQG